MSRNSLFNFNTKKGLDTPESGFNSKEILIPNPKFLLIVFFSTITLVTTSLSRFVTVK